MLSTLLTIFLCASTGGDDGGKPGDTDLLRAHELLAGSWQFVSITDKGEKLGSGLLGERFAQDGVLTVAGREMTIVSPETGEKRTATYRIDPSARPRQIDLVTRNDRIFRGIYKFEDEDLIVCLQPGDRVDRPDDFTAPDGTDRILVRLKTISRRTEAARRPGSSASDERTAAAGRDPGPSESALRRAHELLSGPWDIVSIVDDGSTLGRALIEAKFAENGRVQVGTRAVAFVSPKSGERRISAIRIDPSKTPFEIDVTTHFDEVLKGIYQFNGEELVICLAKREDLDRPTEFKAPTGSGDILFRLAMAKPEAPVRTSEPVARRPSPPVDPVAQKENLIKQKIGGGWSYTDSKGNLTLVFRPDGTFTATRSWRSGLKRIFEGDTTTSDGRWAYGGGRLDAYVTSTMDPSLVGRNYHFRLQSVGDNTMVLANSFGELRTARRLQ